MNNLNIKGKQKFMDLEIPIIEGGFGEGKKCITDKTISEIHNMEIKHVRELINRNIRRFINAIDFIDLKVVVDNDYNLEVLELLGYRKMQISKANNIYLLS
ncbi:ORF6N domain-containing protein, partial [Clostridioides difficile]|nr:ORF6N domain-containing protein [Clostridioides difficile]